MARKRSRLLDYVVYLAVRFVVCVLQALPYETCMDLSRGLAWLVYKLDRRHRKVADDNLRFAFPDLSDHERDELVRGVFRHFVGMAVTLAFLPRLFHTSSWKQYLHMPDGRAFVSVLLSGRPVLLVTGHFGNWELGNVALGVLGFRTASIARKLDNPYLHKLLLSLRSRQGQALLDKNDREDYYKMLAVLESDGILATLGDQDAGQRGLYVDFFNRLASTHKAMALMALQYQTPVVVVGVARVGEPMRHRLIVEDVILPEEYDGKKDAVRSMTQRITDGLERLGRRYPEQYFWLHRRWKHQPKAKKAA
jgi:KDO2-lipid IV(A) lauroyltransferase